MAASQFSKAPGLALAPSAPLLDPPVAASSSVSALKAPAMTPVSLDNLKKRRAELLKNVNKSEVQAHCPVTLENMTGEDKEHQVKVITNCGHLISSQADEGLKDSKRTCPQDRSSIQGTVRSQQVEGIIAGHLTRKAVTDELETVSDAIIQAQQKEIADLKQRLLEMQMSVDISRLSKEQKTPAYPAVQEKLDLSNNTNKVIAKTRKELAIAQLSSRFLKNRLRRKVFGSDVKLNEKEQKKRNETVQRILTSVGLQGKKVVEDKSKLKHVDSFSVKDVILHRKQYEKKRNELVDKMTKAGEALKKANVLKAKKENTEFTSLAMDLITADEQFKKERAGLQEQARKFDGDYSRIRKFGIEIARLKRELIRQHDFLNTTTEQAHQRAQQSSLRMITILGAPCNLALLELSDKNSLEQKREQTAKDNDMPILIKRGGEFSIYGYLDGKWSERKLVGLYKAEMKYLNELRFDQPELKKENIREPLFTTLKRGHRCSPKKLEPAAQKAMNDGFCQAVRDGRVEDAREFLSNGADVNSAHDAGPPLKRDAAVRSLPVFFSAIYQQKHDMVNLLLENNIDVHRCNVDPVGNEEGGKWDNANALMLAASQGAHKSDPRLMQLLLNKKADINQKQRGNWTAAHFAVLWENSNNLRFLMCANADVTITNEQNQTALQMAAERKLNISG